PHRLRRRTLRPAQDPSMATTTLTVTARAARGCPGPDRLAHPALNPHPRHLSRKERGLEAPGDTRAAIAPDLGPFLPACDAFPARGRPIATAVRAGGAARRPPATDDARGEARTAPTARGRREDRASPRRATSPRPSGAGRLPLPGARRPQRERCPASRGRGVSLEDTDPDRLRRDPRLPHRVPDPGRRGARLGPGH